MVVGVGGRGGNAVAHMIACGVQGVELICADTDAQALSAIPAHHIIQLGTNGVGTGGQPRQGHAAAKQSVEAIREAIHGADILFIVAGTGMGATAVMARIAREQGILTAVVLLLPLGDEGTPCQQDENDGRAELEAHVDSLFVVLDDNLQTVFANNVIRHTVGGLAEIISVISCVSIDMEDIRTVLKEPGAAVMGTAVASGPDRARIAAERAAVCSLCEDFDIKGVKAMVVLISGSKRSIRLSEVKVAIETIIALTSPDVTVINGMAYDDTLQDQIRVTMIATGLNRVQRHT